MEEVKRLKDATFWRQIEWSISRENFNDLKSDCRLASRDLSVDELKTSKEAIENSFSKLKETTEKYINAMEEVNPKEYYIFEYDIKRARKNAQDVQEIQGSYMEKIDSLLGILVYPDPATKSPARREEPSEREQIKKGLPKANLWEWETVYEDDKLDWWLAMGKYRLVCLV